MSNQKIFAYEVREDERAEMEALAARLDIDLAMTAEVPSMENADAVKGCIGVTILGQGNINKELLSAWAAAGVRFVSTRTIGIDHIDVEAAKSLGIRVCNARYAPNGVAEFTIMLMLICLRNYKQASWRSRVNDFSLRGLEGRELKDLTVGVMGTGHIGQKVIEILSSFGCRIVAFDHHEKEAVKQFATYVTEDELYAQSDVITLHLPALPSTHHIIDAQAIAKMKDGVVLVNCARGELMDVAALVDGVESKKIGAIGMDTIEGETGMVHTDRRSDILANRDLFYLMQFSNVVITQHMAFYTEAAVRSMVECGIEGIAKMAADEHCATEL